MNFIIEKLMIENITYTILDFRFWIVEVLLLGSFSNLNVATTKQNGITVIRVISACFLTQY